MFHKIKSNSHWLAIIVSGASLLPGPATATVVEFQTNMGNFEVNLYDTDVPQTVGNFLAYLNAYTESVVHRSVSNFVIQGGSFFFDPATESMFGITANAPVVNEPEFSNVRRTISMARPPTGVDTATSGWFINIANNSGSLDPQRFAVFGEVLAADMGVIDAIAALPKFAFQSPFAELPLANYSNTDFANGVTPDATHLVIVHAIVITDATVDSAGAAGLVPPVNTSINPPPGPALGGGGGSIGIIGLLGLLIACRRRLTGAANGLRAE
jgi:cyclophilin family peptidyl-prolyl cis-trans isomerase